MMRISVLTIAAGLTLAALAGCSSSQAQPGKTRPAVAAAPAAIAPAPALPRPLTEYEQAVGGDWR